MSNVPKELIQKFLVKATENSISVDEGKTHLDLWFYQMMMSQLKISLSNSDNILHIEDKALLSDVNVIKKETAAIVYDSGDEPCFIPESPNICVFKRMTCLSLIECNSYDFVASAPFQLGIDVNRHTLASYKGKATHFILPFDLLLYVEKEKLDHYGAEAMSTNLFNQNGFLFHPHIVPSVVTGFLTQNTLSDLTAFVAQPNAIRPLFSDMGIDINSNVKNEDINDDVLLGLKVFKYRYNLPINPESMREIERFDEQLKSSSPQISVKIGNNEVHIVKPPRH